MKKVNEKLNDTIENNLKKIGEMINVDAAIGNPVKLENGDVFVPVSKVTYGFVNAGGEYGKVSIFKEGSDLPYSVGSGAVVSIKPCGFFIKQDNNYKVISTDNDFFTECIEKINLSFEKIKNLFGNKK